MRHLVHSLKLQVIPPVIIFWDIIVSLSAFKYSKCFVLCPPSDMHANKVNLFLKNFSAQTFLFVIFQFFDWGSFQQELVCCVPLRRILSPLIPNSFEVMRVSIWWLNASWMINLNFFLKVNAALIFAMLFMRSWAAPWMSSSEAIPVGHIRRAWKGHGCLIDSSTSFFIIIIFIVHGSVDVFFWSNSGRPH